MHALQLRKAWAKKHEVMRHADQAPLVQDKTFSSLTRCFHGERCLCDVGTPLANRFKTAVKAITRKMTPGRTRYDADVLVVRVYNEVASVDYWFYIGFGNPNTGHFTMMQMFRVLEVEANLPPR